MSHKSEGANKVCWVCLVDRWSWGLLLPGSLFPCCARGKIYLWALSSQHHLETGGVANSPLPTFLTNESKGELCSTLVDCVPAHSKENLCWLMTIKIPSPLNSLELALFLKARLKKKIQAVMRGTWWDLSKHAALRLRHNGCYQQVHWFGYWPGYFWFSHLSGVSLCNVGNIVILNISHFLSSSDVR